MNRVQTQKRITELKRVINHHRYLYHVLDKAEISDAALDSLKHELKELEDAFPEFITPDSPTQRVGGKPLEKFLKVKHKVKQWSLEDAFCQSEIREWEGRAKRFLHSAHDLDYVGELKIDGLHVVLSYEKGMLKTGATRGDGETGEDVTQNLKTIEAIPLRLQREIDCVVEGEVFMRKSVLETLNRERKQKGLPILANPRNAAAGAIRQLDSRIVAERKLDAFVYEFSWPEDRIPHTQKEELELLAELGFKVNTHWRYLKSIGDVVSFWKQWEKDRDSEDYWVDGIVVKVNNRSLQQALGYTGKAPRFTLAAKFSPEEKTTIVEKIIASVGRTGKITPVALLKPVEIKGTVVSRATLHNYDEIARLDVRQGDTVIVTKAGDVIPQVIGVVQELRPKDARAVVLPARCPICGKALMQRKGEVDIFCTNPSCGALRAKRLIHFVSKAGLDVEGMGKKIVSRLMELGLITNIADIFTLKEEDIEELEGFGEKSAKNLVEAIERAKTIPLWKFFIALGIDYVGSQAALWIEDFLIDRSGRITTPGKLLRVWMKLTPQDLTSIEGIGPKASESFTAFIKEKKNQALLETFDKRSITFILPEQKAGTLAGKTFVFTGELEKMTRSEAQELVRQKGGKVSESISKRVNYLVAGKEAGSKLAKAKKLGVSILSEGPFLKMVS